MKILKLFLILLLLFPSPNFSMQRQMDIYDSNKIPIFSSLENRQPLFLDKEITQYSNFLETFLTVANESFKPENLEIDLDFRAVNKVVNTVNLFVRANLNPKNQKNFINYIKQLELNDLLNVYLQSDQWGLEELKKIVGDFFNTPKIIRQLATLNRSDLKKLRYISQVYDIKTHIFSTISQPKPLIENVDHIRFLDATTCLVRTHYGCWQLYSLNGNAIGPTLKNVQEIDRLGDDILVVKFVNNCFEFYNMRTGIQINHLENVNRYLLLNDSTLAVQFNDFSFQLYNLQTGLCKGNRLININYFRRLNDSIYAIIFSDGSLQFYNVNGCPIADLIENVFDVFLLNDSRVMILFNDRNDFYLQLYNSTDGTPINEKNLQSVKVFNYFQESGTYLLRFTNNTSQLYNVDNGAKIGSIFNNVDDIYLLRNTKCLIKLSEGEWQLYNIANGGRSKIFKKVKTLQEIHDGKFLIQFDDDSWQIYNSNDCNPLGNKFQNVVNIFSSLAVPRFIIQFNNNTAELFNSENGQRVGALFIQVYRVYLFNYSRFFIEFMDGCGQLYNFSTGEALGETFAKIRNVKLLNNTTYLITYEDNSKKLYNLNDGSYILDTCEFNDAVFNNNILFTSTDGNIHKNELQFLVKEVQDGYQVETRNEIPIGLPFKNIPEFINTTYFKTIKKNQPQFYSYQEIPLIILLDKIMHSNKKYMNNNI